MSHGLDHEHLLQTLKFTPIKVKLSVYGYGGEIVMGTISQDAYDFWSNCTDEELTDFVLDNGEQHTVPDHVKFVEPGAWYECDDIVHMCGAELSAYGGIRIENSETGDVIWEINSLDTTDLENIGVQLLPGEEYYASQLSPGTCCYFGQSIEKGNFFGTEFVLTSPFDPEKLAVSSVEIEGAQMITGIAYDDEELEDFDGADTWSKGMQFALLRSASAQEHRD